MKLSKKALKEFLEIYFQEYGIKLDEKEAQDKAYRLLVLVKTIYKPFPYENKTANIEKD